MEGTIASAGQWQEGSRHGRCVNVTRTHYTRVAETRASEGVVGCDCSNYGSRKVVQYVLMMEKEVGRWQNDVSVMAGKARWMVPC